RDRAPGRPVRAPWEQRAGGLVRAHAPPVTLTRSWARLLRPGNGRRAPVVLARGGVCVKPEEYVAGTGTPAPHTLRRLAMISLHTMAKVKNDLLAEGDTPEPQVRVIGEEQVVAAADMLIANTVDEAKDLINSYDADPARVEVVHPGVDLDAFRPVPMLDAR